MPRIMTSAEALDIQAEFESRAPEIASPDEIASALDVVSARLQVSGDGIFLRLVGRDGRSSDIVLNPAAAMLINGTLRQTLEEQGWVDEQGFVTSG